MMKYKKKNEDTKEVMRSCNLKKDRQYSGQMKMDKRKTTADITLHRKLKKTRLKWGLTTTQQVFS